jgi:hypothetical protein
MRLRNQGRYRLSWYKGPGEKCILQGPEGQFDRAPEFSSAKTLGKNYGILGGIATHMLPAPKSAGGGREPVNKLAPKGRQMSFREGGEQPKSLQNTLFLYQRFENARPAAVRE